ncbi:hypothetical protein ABFT80_23775, partial [Mesorhizobium sp. SB112]|uniref:hypothetical protein n=1 Tax=Mesorhizobium sp. SB112 TaxID=3151853 RepID=UPI0032641C97
RHAAQVPWVPDAKGDVQPAPIGYGKAKHVDFRPALHSSWNQQGGFKDEVRLANDANGLSVARKTQ